MAVSDSFDFQECFQNVADPRISRTRVHLLTDVLFLAVCGTIAGADGPSDIEAFGKAQIQWLRRFVKLEFGIPSHDTIGRIFARLKPQQFQEAFLNWIKAFFPDGEDQPDSKCIPIDGKTLRGSHNRKAGQNPLHLVSAWCAKNRLTLGQVAVDAKSNEITAIPELLKLLELRGAIVSIDAMGCQKEIAKRITDGGGDYVLAVKENQPKLAAAVAEAFSEMHENDFADSHCRRHATEERSRGRDETRSYYVAPVPASMSAFVTQWPGLTSIGQVVTHTTQHGKETSDVRYYINSIAPQVKIFAESVRAHWSIENSLHWTLDMIFGEDASRIHIGNGAENFGFLRRFAISLLNRDTSSNSTRRKRKIAAWSTEFLEKLLFPSN